MSTITDAQALKTELETALGDLVDLVTLDGTGVKPSIRAAVVIAPPAVDFTTFTERDTTWTLYAIASPADRPLIAWEALDEILTRLEETGFNLKQAQPARFGLAGTSSLPAYEIVLNPS